MAAQQDWTFADRAGWPAGPWDGEPDKVQWRDEATGLPCLAVRGPVGSWCGYAGVDTSSPLHGLDYDAEELADVDVHGGLTFSGPCQKKRGEHGICHVAEPGEPDDVWWFGFDCAHLFDLVPALLVVLPDRDRPDDEYRDLAYVQAETRRLAAQLPAVALTAVNRGTAALGVAAVSGATGLAGKQSRCSNLYGGAR